MATVPFPVYLNYHTKNTEMSLLKSKAAFFMVLVSIFLKNCHQPHHDNNIYCEHPLMCDL